MSKFFEEEAFQETKKEQKKARRLASHLDRSKYKKTDLAKKERRQINSAIALFKKI